MNEHFEKKIGNNRKKKYKVFVCLIESFILYIHTPLTMEINRTEVCVVIFLFYLRLLLFHQIALLLEGTVVYINRVMMKKKLLTVKVSTFPFLYLTSCLPYYMYVSSTLCLVVCFWWWLLLLLCPFITHPISSWSRCFQDTTTCHKSCFMLLCIVDC